MVKKGSSPSFRDVMCASQRAVFIKRFARDPHDPIGVFFKHFENIHATTMAFHGSLRATGRLLSFDTAAEAYLKKSLPSKELADVKRVAREQAQEGYPVVFGYASILIWSATETFFRDAVKAWLSGPSDCWRGTGAISEKFDINDYEKWREDGSLGEKLFDVVERKSRESARDSPLARWQWILKQLRLTPRLGKEHGEVLRELVLVRNLLAHSPGGIVDDQFWSKWSNRWRKRWPGLKSGDRLSIGYIDVLGYLTAAASYCNAIDRRIGKRIGEMSANEKLPSAPSLGPLHVALQLAQKNKSSPR